LIDQVLLIFGHPHSISAQIFKRRPNALVDDGFDLVLNYPSMKVELQSDLSEQTRAARFELQGELGSFLKFGLDNQNRRLLDDVKPSEDGFGVEPPDLYGTLETDQTRRVTSEPGRYVSFYEGVAQSLLSGVPAPVDASAGYETLLIIEAALRSASEGRAVSL
jgi:scyllo-inositol 2-dehydrogenase (NADP+)